MSKTSFYWPPTLRDTVAREAATAGISTSEFIRLSLAFRITWVLALRTVAAGADPNRALDADEMQAALEVLARELGPKS